MARCSVYEGRLRQFGWFLGSGPVGDDDLWYHRIPGMLHYFFFSLFLPSPWGLPPGSEALPAGFGALPAGSESLKAGSEALPAGSEAPPAGSKAHPTCSKALPALQSPQTLSTLAWRPSQ